MANKKRLAATFGAMALTAVIAIGGTLAYLSNVTETKKNTFTSTGKDVDGSVVEEKWETEGKDKAENYTPGQVIAKDPTIKLEAGSESAWVGVKLEFLGSDGTRMAYGTPKTDNAAATGFNVYASHDGIKAGWVLIAKNAQGSELYAYQGPEGGTGVIAGGESAPTIFDNITVNSGVTKVTENTQKTYYTKKTELDANGNIIKEELAEVVGDMNSTTTYYDENGNAVGAETLPKFEILVKGFAVQAADNTDFAAVKKQIIDLANASLADGEAPYNAI